jgi:hypothetical protein
MNKTRIPSGLVPGRRLYETAPAASGEDRKWQPLMCLEAWNRMPAETY